MLKLKLILFIMVSTLLSLPAAVARATDSLSGAIGPETVQDFVRRKTRRLFKGRKNGGADAVAQAILQESKKHDFDPVLLMAVIQNESRFSPRKRGTHGEIGLMQVKPSTARWVARLEHLPWRGPKTLEDPVQNIRIGASYLATMRRQFDSQKQLYLAAYNMGAASLRRSMKHGVLPREYPLRVMAQYRQLF
jgi:soluble lytic murein transglycosylase